MFFETVVLKFSVALLSGYLALSQGIATGIEHSLVKNGLMTERPKIVATHPTAIEDSLTTIPSRYNKREWLPKILLENIPYQQAAVAGAGSSRAHEPLSSSEVEDVLVNILCMYQDGDHLRATTGSGVFIDPKGIILTNAHVAQFLLIQEFRDKARCTIRQGTPATDRYEADLLYISPAWIYENAPLVDAPSPSGTGERDYALLYVKNALNGEMPVAFPAAKLHTEALSPKDRGREVVIGGYPADIFREKGFRAALEPEVARTRILDLFTFSADRADLFSLAPSKVGEHGSSGGPVFDTEGALLGLIVTKGDEESEGAHSLRALSLPYIDATIQEETGFDLSTTLEGNIARRSHIFKDALVPFLATLLRQELN